MVLYEVNCEWDDWVVSDCSRTCAGGWKTKTRKPKVLAEHGGEDCTGADSLEETCNLHNCPGMKLN